VLGRELQVNDCDIPPGSKLKMDLVGRVFVDNCEENSSCWERISGPPNILTGELIFFCGQTSWPLKDKKGRLLKRARCSLRV
jgi:hypothetical protein